MFKEFLRQKLVWGIVPLVLISVLAACSSESNSDSPEIDATQGAQMLAGIYGTQITEADLPQDAQDDEELKSVLGTWKIVLTVDGKFTAEQNGHENFSGAYQAQDNKMEIAIQSVCATCSCDENIGRYFWQLSDNELSFRTDYDLCDAEVFLLTAKPLKRAP
jgi:hypothetical protein